MKGKQNFDLSFAQNPKHPAAHVLFPLRQNVTCAFGFEPGRRHHNELKDIERAYHQCGWRANFMVG